MYLQIAAFSAILAGAIVSAEPQPTAAAQLEQRQAQSILVGYLSTNGGYSGSRTCDYPQTISTSGSYVQCCPTTGACPFYTACTSNTLYAAGASVSCDFTSTLTCNTAIIEASASAAGNSYLACWQKSLGSSPFTFVQNVGTATVAAGSAASTGSGSSSGSSGSSGSTTTNVLSSRSSYISSVSSSAVSVSSASTASAASAASASSTKNVAPTAVAGLTGGVVGAAALIAQLVL